MIVKGGSPSTRRKTMEDLRLLRWRHSELPANETCQEIVDFGMTGYRALPRRSREVHPPGMPGAFLEQRTAVPLQVADEFSPLHKVITSHTSRVEAAGRERRSTGSSMRVMASRRFSRASFSVLPWVSAPGTSSVQATHHFPWCRNWAWIRRRDRLAPVCCAIAFSLARASPRRAVATGLLR